MSIVAFMDAFDQILGWMIQKRRARKIVANLAPSATAAQLAAAEDQLGFPLGAELRAMWSVHAGQREELDGFVESYDLLSIDRAIDETRSLRRLLAATRRMPDRVPESGLTEAELASETWVMFAARDSDGLAINTTSGRVFEVEHDDAPPLHFVAPSLLAWITGYASRVAADDYELEEGFGAFHLSPRDRAAEAREEEAKAREKERRQLEREEKKRKSKLPPLTLLEEAIAKNAPEEAESVIKKALRSRKVIGEVIAALFASAPAPAFIAATLRTSMNELTLTSAQWHVVAEGGTQLGNPAIHDMALARDARSKMKVNPSSICLPIEANIESMDEGAPDALLRTDSGVPLHCARGLIPEGAGVGARVVAETGAYIAPLFKWRVSRVRLVGAQVTSPVDAAERFWTRALGPLDTPEARLSAITTGSQALNGIKGQGIAEGRMLAYDEREPFLTVGRARFADVAQRAADVAPTLARHRLSGELREAWDSFFEERARSIPPDTSSAAPELVRSVHLLRDSIQRGACGRASISPPASPYERAQHHARTSPSAPIRELLGLTNGFSLHGGVLYVKGIFDGGVDMLKRDGGADAGTIHALFARPDGKFSEFTVACAPDGRLVLRALEELPSGSFEWREVPSGPSVGDLASFLTALATLDLRALRALFPPDAPPWQAPSEPADLAPIQRLDGPEVPFRALGVARAGTGDPWGAFVLAQLAGKSAPSEAELRAIAGALEPAFRKGKLDDEPALTVAFRRGFAWRVRVRSTFDFHARYVLRELRARPWGLRFEHLEVDQLNVSHPHRFGDLWEIFEETGLPRGLRSLAAGNVLAEHLLPRSLPPMEELTLIGRHYELPHGTDLGSLKRLTLEGAVHFDNFRSARWSSPGILTLRASDDLDEEEEELIESIQGLLEASFVAALPSLRLEKWGGAGARAVAEAFARSGAQRIELLGCTPSFVSAMQKALGRRVALAP